MDSEFLAKEIYNRNTTLGRGNFNDIYCKMYPGKNMPKNITFIVTEDCNLNCSYCYQTCKSKKRMSLDIAKRCINFLFEQDMQNSEFINEDSCDGLILDFIGGEPLLEVELIDKTISYFLKKAILLNHRWKTKYMISISTNGTLYKEKNVEKFMKKYDGRLSLNVTIDGNEKLHNSCRVFKDGTGSYAKAADAFMDLRTKYNNSSTKITLAPQNIGLMTESIIDMQKKFNLTSIFANFVFEDVWSKANALTFYNQAIKLADYLVDSKLYKTFSFSLFNPLDCKPMSIEDNQNWCGGNGKMLAFDTEGKIFPCLRYTKMCLNGSQEPYCIGCIDSGIGTLSIEREKLSSLEEITRKSQSTEECFNCPIAQGCSWCTAYNYQVFGSPNQRATFICDMHKARALATTYFWNRVFAAEGYNEHFSLLVPEKWAVEIIREREYAKLVNLAKEK